MANRLIDANELMDVIRQHEYRLATKQGSIDYGMFTLGIQQSVDEQPTVDAVEVVRCKDCKHWLKDVAGCTDFVGRCEFANYMVGATGYCSYGERKDGD